MIIQSIINSEKNKLKWIAIFYKCVNNINETFFLETRMRQQYDYSVYRTYDNTPFLT